MAPTLSNPSLLGVRWKFVFDTYGDIRGSGVS